jgi:hypothetical protein
MPVVTRGPLRFANVGVPVPAPPAGQWPAKFTFDEFWSFTEPLEGGYPAVDCMFLVQDLQVATAMGITFTNKANRNAGLAMAKALEWVYKPGHGQAGQFCSSADIERDYDAVLDKEDIGRKGPGHLPEWKAATNCRITLEGLKRAVRRKIIGNINYIKTQRPDEPHRGKENRYFGDFDTFPADAQLCIASLTWANGAAFHYPSFQAACRAAKWFDAAKECTFKNKENTLQKREDQQKLMMHNAGCAALGVANPDVLHFPTKLTAPSAPTGPSGPTGFRERESLEISLG